MIEPFLTHEMVERIARLPRQRRGEAMRVVAQEEWKRCAEDITYWCDPKRHPIPYVYTRDPHPMFVCKQCSDGEAYTFDKRKIHLSSRHSIDTDTEFELRGAFTELDTIRLFELREYFKPIVEQWLKEPLLALEKSRDMMMTWLIVICYSWDTLFHKGRQNIFQSKSATDTRELIDRAKTVFINQPKWLQSVAPAYTSEGQNRAGKLVVPVIQSELLGFAQGADKVRQYHPSGFFSDEAAFNPDAEESFAAIKPAIANGGRYTAISSANPGWFMRICRDVNV